MNKKAMPAGRQGFTLIEILVVVVIVGILAGITLTASMSSRKVARDGRRKADLEQIRSALEIYRSDCKTYPSFIDFGGTDQLVGVEAICSGNVYMDSVPKDPLLGTYRYSYLRNSSNSYTLCSYLETNRSTTTGCDGNCGDACYYKVTNY